MIDSAVRMELARGAHVEHQGPHSASVIYGRPFNHLPHLIAGLLTCGLWFLVWPIMWALNVHRRVTLTIDERGQLVRTEVKA